MDRWRDRQTERWTGRDRQHRNVPETKFYMKAVICPDVNDHGFKFKINTKNQQLPNSLNSLFFHHKIQ